MADGRCAVRRPAGLLIDVLLPARDAHGGDRGQFPAPLKNSLHLRKEEGICRKTLDAGSGRVIHENVRGVLVTHRFTAAISARYRLLALALAPLIAACAPNRAEPLDAVLLRSRADHRAYFSN
jgi:hypothetical protein